MIKKRMILLSIVIFAILLASVIGILWIQKDSTNKHIYAEIYRDDECIDTIDLTNVDKPYQITYTYGEDGYNVVEVREGEIGIVEASCPDHLCVNMGFIHNNLMPVTCLPNHLIIRLYNDDRQSNGGLDGVAY